MEAGERLIKAWPRLVALMYLMLWVAAGAYCWFMWDGLGILGKASWVSMELLFAPDLAGVIKVIKGKPP